MPVSRKNLIRLLVAAAAVGLGWAGLRWFERANLYFPSSEFTFIPRTFGMAHEEVALVTEDGVRLHAWLIPAASFRLKPREPERTGPLHDRGLVVLLCHGNAGNISNRVQKANILHRLGLGVLLFDYRGFGRSEGTPSEQGTYRDAEAAWKYLVEIRKLPPERIVIYGESIGNGIAIETALRHPPRALIVQSAFTSIVEMGKLVFPWLPVRWMVTFRYDNLAKIPKVRAPVLVMHSKDDDTIPFEMGRRLFEAAPEPKRFLEMYGTHDDAYLDMGPAYPDAIRAFLEATDTPGARK